MINENKLKRYAITFYKTYCEEAEAAEILNIPPNLFKDGCDTLSNNKPILDIDVLHYPEIGVSYVNLSDEQVKRIRKDKRVKQVRISKKLSTNPLPAESAKSFQVPSSSELVLSSKNEQIFWNIKMVKADEVWHRVTGSGVKVGIIDSGIDKNHPDLKPVDGVSCVAGTSISDWDDVEDGHGTFCAGIVAARKNNLGIVGVAPDCSLYAIKVSKGMESSIDWILAGMTWAIRKKLDVVSISLWDLDGAESPNEEPWADMNDGAQLLIDNGCVVVGIAGNSGGRQNHWVTNPGRCPGFICVGALDNKKEWWYKSSYGPSSLPENQAVELIAPGVNIISTYRGGQYARGDGTSYACPHVTGAVALLKQLYPGWTPEEIRLRLKKTADDLGNPGRDAKYGTGLLNCYRALFDPL